MTEQLKAIWKKLLSYTKKNWELSDYPLRYKIQTNIDNGEQGIIEIKPWSLQVINWWSMGGLGDTKEEAYEDLKSNFKKYLENNQAPRPGSNVPLVFADTTEIEELEDVAPEFFEKILELNYYDCFISDESSLDDFGRNDDVTLQKINEIYHLNMTDLGDGNLVRLFKLIKQ